MPVIRTLVRFTESFVFYSIESFPNIRTFHAGYNNLILLYDLCGYKNMFVDREYRLLVKFWGILFEISKLGFLNFQELKYIKYIQNTFNSLKRSAADKRAVAKHCFMSKIFQLLIV